MNQEQAKENLTILHELLTGYGITPILVFGTLLGAHREGGFIAHDKDTDVAVMEADFQAFRRFVREKKWQTKGFKLYRDWKGIFSIWRGNEYIDIYSFSKLASGDVVCEIRNNKMQVAARYRMKNQEIEKLHDIKFIGLDWKCPAPEPYLTRTYGDWKTPKKDHHAPMFS